MIGESLSAKRISELEKDELVNDIDVFPLTRPLGDIFRTIGGSLSQIRDLLNFKYAVETIDDGLLKTLSGQVFHVWQLPAKKYVTEYLNDNGVAVPTGGEFLNVNAVGNIASSDYFMAPLSSGDVVFSVTDSGGRAALTIDKDSIVEVINLLVSSERVRLKSGGVLGDVVNTLFDSVDTAFAVTDNNGALSLRVRTDGTLEVNKLSIDDNKTFLPDGRTLSEALCQGVAPDKGNFDVQIINGALYSRDMNTQKRYLIKDSDVTSAEIKGDNVVLKVGSDDFYAALPDGKVFKRFPSMRLSCIGDSLTNGFINGVDTDSYPLKLGALLNIPVEKRGWSGRASGDIALRMGATVVKLTVTGNTIPASGAVVVALVDPATGYRSGMLDNYPEGTLAGVTGMLSRSESNVWTFTRKTAGNAVPCPPGSEYLHNGYPTANDGMVITWMGRNNYESMFAEVMRDQQQFTRWITTLNKQQIVIGITNTADEPRGSANYDAILRVNSELAAAYPGRYFDAMRYLIDHGLSDAGITPTAQDLTDISKDIIPSSLRIDNTHFNAVGYQLIANQLYQLIQQLGWK